MRRETVVDLVGFQLVWWISAIGAAHGASAPGIGAAAAFISARVVSGSEPGVTLATAASVGIIGLCAESLLVLSGSVRYAAQWPSETWAPAWIVALWMALGAALGSVRLLLRGRSLRTAALIGAALGPLSYLAGASLGALRLPESRGAVLAVIALTWAVVLPLLLVLRESAEALIAGSD